MFTMKNISKALIWLVVHAIAFLALVWLLLGFSPMETYTKSKAHLTQLYHSTRNAGDTFSKVTHSMSRVAGHHVNEMNDRTRGIDPYEKYNSNVDQTTRQGVGM